MVAILRTSLFANAPLSRHAWMRAVTMLILILSDGLAIRRRHLPVDLVPS